jgi:hypothetical protein
MSQKRRKPSWLTQEEWDEWVAGEDERSRRLWERAKRGEEELKAKRRAEVEPPKRRRLFGLLPL